MGALEEARGHLQKADEFLAAAESNLELDLCNAATSNAVSAGINAKDAICLKLTGRSGKADRHGEAVDELRRAGAEGARLAPTMARLLKLKNRSQYQAASVASTDAARAVEWARRMCVEAKEIVVT